MTRCFRFNDETVSVAARRDPSNKDTFWVTVGEETHTVVASMGSDGMMRLSHGEGRQFKAAVDRDGLEAGRWWLTMNGATYRFQEDEGEGRRAEASAAVEAPMPGKVLEVKVKAGQAVKTGEVLMIVEAMKMEHPLKAPRDATVAEVKPAVGDMVKPGRPLVVFE